MIGAQSNPWSWIDPGAFALVGAGKAAARVGARGSTPSVAASQPCTGTKDVEPAHSARSSHVCSHSQST